MVTFKGNPVELEGETVAKGQKAPDFRGQKSDMSEYSLETSRGKTRIFAAVPSLDTPVCSTEMQKFSKAIAATPGAELVCVSMDLPFAQKRWCGANDAANVLSVSDHKDASFGRAYGCLIKSGPLERILCRAVFVVGPDDTVRHVEYCADIGTEPDYEAALNAAR